MFEYIPRDARPREAAILILYHHLHIKNTEDLRQCLNYRTKRPVEKVLKKYRGVIPSN